MSATGLEVFDKTLQTANIWLGEMMERLDCDRQSAWRALSVVLQRLRDRLPLDLAAHLGAQLPLIVRGVYYDQFSPGRAADTGAPADLIAAVAEGLDAIDAEDAVMVVFDVLGRHLSEGQAAKLRGALPQGLQMLWDGADARALSEAGA